VRILIHVIEIHSHCLQEIFANGLRELPPPLCVQVRVRNNE